MSTTEQIEGLIKAFTSWASAQSDVHAAALVGSYAKGAATENSDIDLIMLVSDPSKYFKNVGWTKQFGEVVKEQVEDYGLVTSLRVWYANGYEIEYGLTTLTWAQLPLDQGTRRVIQDGMQVLLDRGGLLRNAAAEIQATMRTRDQQTNYRSRARKGAGAKRIK